MRARSLTLPGQLDTSAAPPLAEAILARRGAPLELRTEKVERVGTPALQVLLSAAATWRADGQRLRLTGHSPALEEALTTLGLTPDHLIAEGKAR